MLKTQVLMLFFLLGSINSSSAFNEFLIMGKKLYGIIKNVSSTASHAHSTDAIILELRDPTTEVGKLIGQLDDLLAEITSLEDKLNIRNVSGIIITPAKEFPVARKLDEWENLQNKANVITLKFNELSEYVQQKDSVTVQIWSDFLETQNKTLHDEIQNFQTIAEKMYYEMDDKLRQLSRTYICTEQATRQNSLALLFQVVMITEFKGYALSTYAIMSGFEDPTERKVQVSSLAENFNAVFEWHVTRFSYYMGSSLRNLKACDSPDRHRIQGETYYEIENLEQAVIFQYTSSLGSKHCNDAIEERLFTFDKKQDYCSGDLYDCKFSEWLSVCRLENNSKRYEWIKTADGQYGMNFDECPNGEISKYEESNSHCICKCHPSDEANWISLEWARTNVTDNMVVIGMRFVLEERVLHLQVKQGKLLANGQIDPSSQNWVPLPENGKVAMITPNKKFYLDSVLLPADHVAVGVKFDDDGAATIRVLGQKFNYLTGGIQSDTVEEVADHRFYQRLRVESRNSIYTNLTHKPTSYKYWIQLEMSKLGHDAGQSMLPLFDGVAVESDPPLPIGGIALVHKGVRGYAGFISPRLFPFEAGTFFVNLTEAIYELSMGDPSAVLGN